MEIPRERLQSIYDNTVNSLGYKTTVGTADKNKVTRRYLGQVTTRPSARLAQAAWDAAATLTPLGPTPPPVGDLNPVFVRDAVMVAGGLSNFAGDPRAEALKLGWTVVEVQLLHTPYADANEAEMKRAEWNPWIKFGWGTYGQGTDAFRDGKDAAGLCVRLGLKAWKANGEAWAEGEWIAKTQQFINGWTAGGAPCPLGWSVLSSDTANFPREFDYQAALSVVGADIDIQVYGASYPLYTVAAGLGMLSKAQVPVGRTTMSFDLNGNGGGPFADYRTWAGPRRVYTQGEATVDTFRQLVRP